MMRVANDKGIPLSFAACSFACCGAFFAFARKIPEEICLKKTPI
jgi:hypothetical protein